MYHILASQRQAQFGAGQAFNHRAIQLQPMRGSVQFSLAVGRAVQRSAEATVAVRAAASDHGDQPPSHDHSHGPVKFHGSDLAAEWGATERASGCGEPEETRRGPGDR